MYHALLMASVVPVGIVMEGENSRPMFIVHEKLNQIELKLFT